MCKKEEEEEKKKELNREKINGFSLFEVPVCLVIKPLQAVV